jgi:hypothetical protein
MEEYSKICDTRRRGVPETSSEVVHIGTVDGPGNCSEN